MLRSSGQKNEKLRKSRGGCGFGDRADATKAESGMESCDTVVYSFPISMTGERAIARNCKKKEADYFAFK
jgi:hypothetical protein